MMVWQVRTLNVSGQIIDVNLFDDPEAIRASIHITYRNKEREDMPYVPLDVFPLSKKTTIKNKKGISVFEIIPTQVYSIGEHL